MSKSDISVDPAGFETERWGTGTSTFDIVCRTGKELDVLALKQTSLDEIRSYSEELEKRARELFSGDLTTIEACPCCSASTAGLPVSCHIFDVAYAQCPTCSHVFVHQQPAVDRLEEHFETVDAYAQPYVDEATIAVRMSEVVRPKLSWVLQIYADVFGERPRTAVDVGAGGGHFVSALEEEGISAQGFELSRAARDFAKRAFNIHLREDDFNSAETGSFDVITFWGLLEYVPHPRDIVRAARRQLSERGLLILEVPRFDCVSTAVQRMPGATVARHLDPTSHVNCFTEQSVTYLLAAEELRPVAAWYFGMDAYELMIQNGLRLRLPDIDGLAASIPTLQAQFDRARICDDLVVAAVSNAG